MYRTANPHGIFWAFLVAGAVASNGLLSACSDEQAPASAPASKDIVEMVPFKTTLILDDAALESLQPETVPGRLVFVDPPDSLQAVEARNVIVGGLSGASPEGLLRYVRKVERSGSTVTLETVGAPLQMAFRKLKVRATRTTPMIGAVEPDWPPQAILGYGAPRSPGLAPLFDVGQGGTDQVLPIEFFVFNGDGDPATKNDQLLVRGEFRGGFEYTVSVDVDWGIIEDIPGTVTDCLEEVITSLSLDECSPEDFLPEAIVKLDIDSYLGAGVMLEGTAFTGFEYPFEMPSIPLGAVPVGPLVFFPRLEFYGAASGRASSQFKIGASAGMQLAGSISAGTSGSTDIDGFLPTPEFEASPPDVNLQANAKAEAGVRLLMMLYDVVGAYVGLSSYATIDADQLRTPCWSFTSGLEAHVGFLAEINVAGIELTLAEAHHDIPLVEKEIATGACGMPPDNGPSVPGDGPTSETLLHPSFEPWSTTLSGDVEHPFVDAQGLRWSQVTQTIDGHWVLASSQASLLSKVNSEGGLVWSHRYWREDQQGPGEDPLRPVRVADAADGRLWVVTHPFGVMKVGQAGKVVWAEGFDLEKSGEGGPFGSSDDQSRFIAAEPDGAGGVMIAGSYDLADGVPGNVRTWMLHLDGDGQVLASYTLGDSSYHLYPTTLIRSGEHWLVAGFRWREEPSAAWDGYAVMLRDDGTVEWSQALAGCSSPRGPVPTAGILHSSGDVVIAGSVGDYGRGFLVRLAPDGTVRWSSDAWPGSDLSYMPISAIAELPTTGFVVAGQYTPEYDPAETFLATFDVAGQPVWLMRYAISSTDASLPAESAFPSLALTDDGGAMVLAHAAYHGAGDDSLWLFKTPARDGVLQFDSSRAVTTPGEVYPGGCSLTAASWKPSAKSFDVVPVARDIVSEAVSPPVESQMP